MSQSNELRAVGFTECCRRLGISARTGERLVAERRFPIPPLPALGRKRRYSTYEIDLYLREASVSDERELARLRMVRRR